MLNSGGIKLSTSQSLHINSRVVDAGPRGNPHVARFIQPKDLSVIEIARRIEIVIVRKCLCGII
jgi:hypothetical protein